ncbi:MAG: hypothetical protein E7G28_12850, partial [Cutibacterium avidum]|nr:hypothetical protein [Cutibacterium avidum]
MTRSGDPRVAPVHLVPATECGQFVADRHGPGAGRALLEGPDTGHRPMIRQTGLQLSVAGGDQSDDGDPHEDQQGPG